MDTSGVSTRPTSKQPLLKELEEKAQELLRVFEVLPAKFQMDGLDIFQSAVNTVIKKITHGRVGSVKFVPVEDTVGKTSSEGHEDVSQSPVPTETTATKAAEKEHEVKQEAREKTQKTDSVNDADINNQTPVAHPGGHDSSTCETPPAVPPADSSYSNPVRRRRGRRQDNVSLGPNIDSEAERALMEAMTPLGSGRRAAMLAAMRIKQEVMSEDETNFSDGQEDRLEEDGRNKRGVTTSSISKKRQLKVKKGKQSAVGLGGLHKCRHCSYICTTKSHLQTHMVVHSGTRAYECERCGKRFTAASSLRRHQKAHEGLKPFDCPICGKSFLELSHLHTHSVVHTGERLYICNMCPKKYTNSANLSRHKRVHTGEMPYGCQQCDLRFRDLSSLKLHTLKHTGEKPYLCDVCNKQFKTSSDFKRHERTHTGERNYECEKCGKRFIQGWHLKQHERMHNDERPWRCEQCEKMFRTKASLQYHTKSHQGIKDYACTICEKSFSTKKYLQNHQVIHTSAKPFECSTCGSFFNQYSNLKRHERIHSDEKKYKCRVCNKAFKYINSLQYHEGIHRGDRKTCEKCGLSFRSKQGLVRHRCDPSKHAVNLARTRSPIVKLEVMDPNVIEDGGTKLRKTRSNCRLLNNLAVIDDLRQGKAAAAIKPQINKKFTLAVSKTRGGAAKRRGRPAKVRESETNASQGATDCIPFEPGESCLDGQPVSQVNRPNRRGGGCRGRGRGRRSRVGGQQRPSPAVKSPDPRSTDQEESIDRSASGADPTKNGQVETVCEIQQGSASGAVPETNESHGMEAMEAPNFVVKTEPKEEAQEEISELRRREQDRESQDGPKALSDQKLVTDSNLSDIELMKKAYSDIFVNSCACEELDPQVGRGNGEHQ